MMLNRSILLSIAALTTVVLAPAGSAQDAHPFPWLGAITGDDVRVRTGASLNHRVLDILGKNDVVVVLRREGEGDKWVEVRVPGGLPCWVREDLLRTEGDQATIERTRVLMRPTPSQKYLPLAGHLEKGDVVRVLSRRAGEEARPGWVQVVSPSRVLAYVHSDFVRRTGPVPADLSEFSAKRTSRLIADADPEKAESASDAKDDALRGRVEAVHAALAKMLSGPKDAWSFRASREELEDVLSQVESDATKMKAADLYRDILVSEKDLELHRARLEREITEAQLREKIRIADDRYREEVDRLSRFAPVPQMRYVAIGWVRRRGDLWVVEKGGVPLYGLESKLFSIADFSGKRIGVSGEMIAEDPEHGVRILMVKSLEIFPGR